MADAVPMWILEGELPFSAVADFMYPGFKIVAERIYPPLKACRVNKTPVGIADSHTMNIGPLQFCLRVALNFQRCVGEV